MGNLKLSFLSFKNNYGKDTTYDFIHTYHNIPAERKLNNGKELLVIFFFDV